MTAEFVGFISQPLIALALAAVFLVTGFLVTRLAFRENPVARFLCQLASFGGFTFMLLAAGVLPSEPTPREGPFFAFVVTSVFKIIWWLAASWLFAGFFRAVLVFKRQSRETRFLQNLFVGLIYVAAGSAIVANVFNMPVGGLLAAFGVIAFCSTSPFKAPWATSSQASCSISRNPIIPATGSSSTAAHKDAWLRRTGARPDSPAWAPPSAAPP